MKQVYVGKITNTHGLKGELRILSTFSDKAYIFKPHFRFYIDDQAYEITHYRKHKNYDMVCFLGIDSIEEAEKLKGKSVYFHREDLKEEIVLETDCIGMHVYANEIDRGIITGIQEGPKYHYYLVERDGKTFYLPNVDAFIKEVSPSLGRVTIEEIEGLLDEN